MTNKHGAYLQEVKNGGSKVRVKNPTPAYTIPKTEGESGQYMADKDYQLKVWKSIGPELRKPKVYQQEIYGDKKKAQGR